MFDWLKSGRHIYMNIKPGGNVFNYRGPVKTEKETESFSRLMAKYDLEVLVLKEFKGKKIDRELNTMEI
jgi:hypothetical protein